MRKHLLIGAGGFIGKHVCLKLASSGEEVFALTRTPNLNLGSNFPNVTEVVGDYRDCDLLDNLLPLCDVVIFLASSSVPHNKSNQFSADVSNTLSPFLNLLELLVKHKVKRLIYASSGGSIYGAPEILPIDEKHPTQPLSSYAILKLTAEHYLRLYKSLYNLEFLSLRISNPYGPGQFPGRGQGVVATFLHNAMNNRPVQILGDGSAVRDYVYIDDVANAFVLSAKSKISGILNISSGIGTSLNQLILMIEDATNLKISVEKCAGQNFAPNINYLDNTMAQDLLSWHPQTDMNEGINITWKWFLSGNL